jgi:hypothetical protein
MKRWYLMVGFFGFLFLAEIDGLCSGQVLADDTKGLASQTITRQQVLGAIKQFRNDPIGGYDTGTMATAVRFAQQSDLVRVEITEAYTPWHNDDISEDFSVLLMGAFIAGNIEYQLMNGVTKNSPVEGVKMVLLAYKSLKNGGYITPVPSLEGWLLLEEKHQLATIGGCLAEGEP